MNAPTATIRPINLQDAPAICAIYNHYVENSIITFDEETISLQSMQTLIQTTTAQYPWLVILENEQVVGYAHASMWKGRCAYRYSAETTVYLSPATQGRGLGTQLYSALIAVLRQTELHSLVGGIALPNPASTGLHEKLGFRQVAQFQQVGRKFNQWIDVGYWQLLLA